MKGSRFFLLVVCLCTCIVAFVGIPKAKAQGVKKIPVLVVDAETGAPVVAATIKVAEKWYLTDGNGMCEVPYDGPTVKLTVKVLGYDEVNEATFSTTKDWRILVKITPTSFDVEEVRVTAQQRATSKLQQAAAITAKVIERNSSKSLGQMLEQIPGVSTISTGGTIYKPVIQGMHSSRILMINNGVKLESQSWGEDHAPEIDHTGSNVVEVVKGAEAVRYGYGAIGGVVIFSQAPLPYGHDKLKVNGSVNLGYTTNDRGYNGTGMVELGWKAVGLRVHGMYQQAGDYRTAQYVLNNTGFKNISMSVLTGVRYKWLTATLYGSIYTSRSGIYYASKVSDVDQLMMRFLAGRPDENTIQPFSYKIIPPFQQTQHIMGKADFKFRLTNDHTLDLSLAYQENLRQEFENRKQAKYSLLPVQDLQLSSVTGELVWNGKWGLLGMESQLGLSGMYQYNYNVPGTKTPAFIPNYAALTMGIFGFHKIKFGPVQCSLGMRYDLRAMDVNGYSSISSNATYYGGFRLYRNFTGMLATYYQITKNIEARVNIGWSWRPPDVNEMYATGLHHGTYWVVGNPNLKSEMGYKAVLGAKYHNAWIVVEPSMFFQYIGNFIYDNIGEGKNRFHNHPSGKFPKFIYGQDNARFFGGDIAITGIPYEGLSIKFTGEWINAKNLSKGNWMPFMPSDRYRLGANYQISWGKKMQWHSAFALESSYVTKQRRFDPSKDLVPESPDAYFLLHASAEVTWDFVGNRSLTFIVMGENILNALYKEYTDRFRYYAHARGAQVTFRTILKF